MRIKNILKSSLTTFNRVSFGKEDNWRSYVTTLSPLATAFNTKPLEKSFRIDNETGLFDEKALRQPNGFYLLKSNAFTDTDRLVHEACSSKRTRKMVEIFDELSDSLCRVADLAEFIRLAHPFKPFATAAEDATTTVNAIVERLNTNQALYNALKQVTLEGDIVPTNQVDKYVAKLFLFDFEQSGIHLDADTRKRIVSLNDAILHLSNLFSKYSSFPRSLPKDALPKSLESAFPSRDGEFLFSHLYSDSPIRLVRQAAYQVYMYPDFDQETRFRNLLLERQDLAKLCGFDTYAHRVLCGSLVENPETVRDFLNNLNDKLRPLAQIEFDAMQKLNNKENPNSHLIQMWDVPYYNNALKKEKVDIDYRECSRYFSLGVCMEGLNKLLHGLYKVTLQKMDVKRGEAWSEDVYKLAVMHDEEGLLGYIYLDLFERHEKPNQDCHFTICGGRELADGTYQLPIVVLMFSLPYPTENVPTLLYPGMVENLFHEMGHAMHSMLARTKYQHVTGTRCSTDFAEVPSILMEYFASDPRVLAEFARDYKTGESIPKDLLNKLCLSRNLLSASELQLQVFYAMADQWFHGNISELGLNDSGDVTTSDVIEQMQQKYYNIPHFPETAWQLRFNHFVGYGAKYYSYLYSKSVASWIWQEHFQKDPFNREAGETYRAKVLAHGGGRPPKDILKEYLKADVTSEKLVQFVINEVKNKSFVTSEG